MGVTAPERAQVTDDHQIRRMRLALPSAGNQFHQGVGGVRVTALHLASAPVQLVVPFRLASQAVGLGVEAVHERQTNLGWDQPSEADHAQFVEPVGEGLSRMLAAMQVLGIDRSQPALAARIPEHLEARALGHRQQLGLRPGTCRFGLHHLRGLRQRQLASRHRGAGVGHLPQGQGRLQLRLGLPRRCPRSSRQPVGGVREALLPVCPTLRGPRRRQHLGRRTRLHRRR